MDRKKKFTDEEIQTILDPKNPSGGHSQGGVSHEDAEVYEMLMSHLEQQPEINIPQDFATSITTRAIREKMKRDFARKVLLYLSVSLPLIIAGFLVIYLMAPDMLLKLVAFVENNMLVVTFSFAVLTAVQLLDNLLIRNKLKETMQ